MLEAKIFYRKLDSLLSKIGKEKSGKDFLFGIVKELENTFGEDLKIGNGRIYEEAEEYYVLISDDDPSSGAARRIPVYSEALQALLKSETYIFDDPSLSIDNRINHSSEYRIPAAFTVRSSEYRWLFVFELKSGWVREEIELCLNTVRTMLSYRLYNEAVKTGMEQAVHIQQSLLPSEPPRIRGYEVAGKSIPAELVGGDLYDYYDFDGEVFGLCIGDASGHGLPAALLVRDVVTGLRMGLEKHQKMVYTFEKLNKVIYKSVYSTSFISLFYAEIEKNGTLLYVNAGHPSPLIYDGSKFSELESTGMIFGALPELKLQRGYSKLETGSLLILYSDGIIERKNSRSEDFGADGIKEVVAKYKNEPASVILEKIFRAAFDFGDEKKWEDDATAVILRRQM